MIDFDSIRKQRSYENITVTATMPLAAVEPIKNLIERYQDDPDKLDIIKELILTEGVKAVKARLGIGDSESSPGRVQRNKPGRKRKQADIPIRHEDAA